MWWRHWVYRSGKSSMQKVVFHKMSPHDTLFIDESADLEVKYVCNNQFVQFQIWDFPGDYDLNGTWTTAHRWL